LQLLLHALYDFFGSKQVPCECHFARIARNADEVITKLLALIPLPGKGYDWAMTQDKSRLFVSIPEKGQIAVIDTSRWEVMKVIEAGLSPGRLALQPDGRYLWVAGVGGSQTSAAAFRADTLEPVARLPLGRGVHAISMTSNSALVFIANGEDDSVTVMDSRTLARVKEIKTGRGPVAVTYSELADAIYVGATEAGEITVIDAKSMAPVKTIQAQPGLADVVTAPGGRHVLAVNRKTDTVQVIDSSSGEIIQTGAVGKAPFEITFSQDLAYINHLASSEVFMLPLTQIGQRGQPLSAVTFPAGQHPLGEIGLASPGPALCRCRGTAPFSSPARMIGKSIITRKEWRRRWVASPTIVASRWPCRSSIAACGSVVIPESTRGWSRPL
jgi:YVTN family beta-propeller protein